MKEKIVELQQILEKSILPKISGLDGISSIDITGDVQQRILITVDPDRLLERGISFFQVSQALRENNVTFPGGAITRNGQVIPVKTTNTFGSVEELEELVVGFPRAAGGPSSQSAAPPQPIRLADVAGGSTWFGCCPQHFTYKRQTQYQLVRIQRSECKHSKRHERCKRCRWMAWRTCRRT